MTIAETLIFELDHEMATTRKLLERVPEKSATWKPHPRSMAMGELAQHIVNLVRFAKPTFEATELDFASPAAATYISPRFESTATLVEMFDRNVVSARATVAAASDTDMHGMWTLRAGPKQIFTLPRAAVVRSFILSHIIHHRGQLSVYLRLNDIPLPPIYGPTADESR